MKNYEGRKRGTPSSVTIFGAKIRIISETASIYPAEKQGRPTAPRNGGGRTRPCDTGPPDRGKRNFAGRKNVFFKLLR